MSIYVNGNLEKCKLEHQLNSKKLSQAIVVTLRSSFDKSTAYGWAHTVQLLEQNVKFTELHPRENTADLRLKARAKVMPQAQAKGFLSDTHKAAPMSGPAYACRHDDDWKQHEPRRLGLTESGLGENDLSCGISARQPQCHLYPKFSHRICCETSEVHCAAHGSPESARAGRRLDQGPSSKFRCFGCSFMLPGRGGPIPLAALMGLNMVCVALSSPAPQRWTILPRLSLL